MSPNVILVMRHAEKPTDDHDPHLSPPGKERAEKLATYIPDTFGKPDFVFAAAVSTQGRSRRSSLSQRHWGLIQKRRSLTPNMRNSRNCCSPTPNTRISSLSSAGTTARSRRSCGP